MSDRNRLSFVAVAAAILFFCTNIDAALNAYMTIKGQKVGLIKGGVIQKGREGTIGVIAMSHDIVSPRDPASGQATGKVQHKPFEVTVEWDQATPRLYTALFTNDLLTDVTIDFYAPQSMGAAGGGAGAEFNHMTIKLFGAHIAAIRSRMLNNKNPELMRYKEYLEVSFVYDKIEINHKLGGGIATGEWVSKMLLSLASQGVKASRPVDTETKLTLK